MTPKPAAYRGDDQLLFAIILGVLAFWLFAQTTLNIAPAMAADLNVATSGMLLVSMIMLTVPKTGGAQGKPARQVPASLRATLDKEESR